MHNILPVLAVIFYSISAIYLYVRFLLKEKTNVLAFVFLILGTVIHGLGLLVFSFDNHRFPASTVPEALSTLTFLSMVLYLWIGRKSQMEMIAVVLLPLTIGSLLAGILFPSKSIALEPMVSAGWIFIHIPLMILSISTLFLTFVLAIMYLIQEKQLKSKQPAFFYYRLPSLQACEELTYRSLIFGFCFLTLGIITGMVWSKYLRHVYWSWDYKEIWSVITWTLYAVLLHGRVLSAWRGRKAAYFAIVGFAFMLFAFVGISLLRLPNYHAF